MEIKQSNLKLVYLAAITYAVIIGLSFMFVKIALRSANPFDILAFRFMASFLAVLITVALGWVKLNYSWERVIKILPLAILYPLLFFAFQTFGLQYADSAEAGIIQASAPIFTLILATYILKEKSSIWQKLSILLTVFGVVYIIIMKGAAFSISSMSDFKGIIFILLSALAFSGYSVMVRPLTKQFSSIELAYMMIIISFIGFNLVAVGQHLVAGTITTFFAPLANLDFVLAVVYLGVLSSLLTAVLTNYVLAHLEASKMVVFANFGTVITIIAGVVFLKEQIFYYHIIGCILIIAGVLGTNFLGQKN